LENEKNSFEVINSELEKSMKKISEVLANAGNGITDFQEKKIVEVWKLVTPNSFIMMQMFRGRLLLSWKTM